jgi:hypothetical protein
VTQPLAGVRAQTINDVIAAMQAMQGSLPPRDGVACFNRLYLAVTGAVLDGVKGTAFEDDAWLSRLDVEFANRFFDAYGDWTARGKCADAWEPLFANREHPRASIRFALAGMNAHINHDLPLAIVDTCHDSGSEPLTDGPHHRDYRRVNSVLKTVEEAVKGAFESNDLKKADEFCGSVDDAVVLWSIADARDVAWHHAETLWKLRNHPHLRGAYEHMLSISVRLAGRGILI